MLFDWLFDYPSQEEFLKELNDLYHHLLKGTYKVDESTEVDFNEMENGIRATYIIKGKDFDDKDIAEKCDDILSGWEKPAKLLKDETEIRIGFPDKDMGFIYKWDVDHECFSETVTCGDFSRPTLEHDDEEKKEVVEDKKEIPLEIPPHYEDKADSEYISHNNSDESNLPKAGERVDPKSYSFVSRYGDVGIIMIDGHWNFLNMDNNVIISDEWYDYISDFRNLYCIVGKQGKFAIFDWWCDQVSGWYDAIDDMLFTDGLCLVRNAGKFYFITTDGYEICDEGFDGACKFHHGFAMVSGVDSIPESKGKWNFIDPIGELLSDTWFDSVTNFDAFYAMVVLNGKSARIDMRGEIFYSNPDDAKKCDCDKKGCVDIRLDDAIGSVDCKSVEDADLAKKLKADIKVENKELITDESDERLVFMPKSALSIFKDIVNAKSFSVIKENNEDVGISLSLSQLISEPEDGTPYDDIVQHVIIDESLMLDRFCKYVKNNFGFSKAVWEGDFTGKNTDVVFKIYF